MPCPFTAFFDEVLKENQNNRKFIREICEHPSNESETNRNRTYNNSERVKEIFIEVFGFKRSAWGARGGEVKKCEKSGKKIEKGIDKGWEGVIK